MNAMASPRRQTRFPIPDSGRTTRNAATPGFTLIEMVGALALAVLLILATAQGLGSFRESAALGEAADRTAAALGEARSRTLASDGAREYGVHFESSRITTFAGPAYAEGSAENIVMLLPATVEISDIALATTSASVVFERLTGASPASGTIAFRSRRSGKTRRIEITDSGMIVVK